jgi:hemerythrin-like domain-containing protein
MPVQIGAKTHSFSDPTGLLSDCHRRIEMFLGLLERVAEIVGEPLLDNVRETLGSSLRYFREAAPKHTEDEEQSLFPRLRRCQHPSVQAAITNLDSLEEQHRRADFLHAKIDRLGRIYLRDGLLPPAEAEQFRESVSELSLIYQEHIRVEDTQVFPAAALALSEDETAVIAAEMAGRRKRP